jgi:hypothetical protein
MPVEKVCKSMQHALKNDPLLWQSIHVEHPLNERLTVDALSKLIERSQGHLQTLILVECLKITNDGLKQVLDISPKITKLCLPGCTRLSAYGIVKKCESTQRMQHARIEAIENWWYFWDNKRAPREVELPFGWWFTTEVSINKKMVL